MGIFSKPALKLRAHRNKPMPEGLWTKCPACGEVTHNLALTENLRVCPKCEYHFTFGARERIANLLDPDSFHEMDPDLVSVDSLGFTGAASYVDRLEKYRARTGLKDAVITGTGKLAERPVALGVMDFNFLAATMGSVVGEKITRLLEAATKRKLPAIMVCASGGARMYEGMLSLMQMAKTSGAVARQAQAGLPYLVVLTNPTTAGVMASFASLGDVILAEPGAMIGFAGPRVVRETTHQELPPGFQTAEFLLDHGLVDRIVPRKALREELSTILAYLDSR